MRPGSVIAALLAAFAFAAGAHAEEGKNPYSKVPLRNGRPVLNLCTATQGGGYWNAGQTIAKHVEAAGFGVNLLPTKGTEANFNGAQAVRTGMGAVAAGGKTYACHILLYQGDGATAFPAFDSTVERIASLYPEPALLIVKDGGGFKSLDDFAKKGTLCVQSGSGARTTLTAFGTLEKDYAGVTVAEERAWGDCIENLKSGTAQGIFYVGSPTSKLMQDLDAQAKTAKLALAKVKDSDLSKGDVYAKVEIRSKVFKNLVGWSNVDTVTVMSFVGVSKPLADILDRKGVLDNLKAAIRKGAADVAAAYAKDDPLAR
jgi:TRAP-type uncharacterized transport system substrate-binding protein